MRDADYKDWPNVLGWTAVVQGEASHNPPPDVCACFLCGGYLHYKHASSLVLTFQEFPPKRHARVYLVRIHGECREALSAEDMVGITQEIVGYIQTRFTNDVA